MTKLLEGKLVTAVLKEKQQQAVADLKTKGITPTLGIIQVGEREDDISYEKGAIKQAEEVGVAVQEQLLAMICRVNKDDASIHGVLLFRPLPNHMNDDIIHNTLTPKRHWQYRRRLPGRNLHQNK